MCKINSLQQKVFKSRSLLNWLRGDSHYGSKKSSKKEKVRLLNL